MYYKPIPLVGSVIKYSNKKARNPRSGQLCKILIASPRGASVHNCKVEFEDGYMMITSKWNLFDKG
jgi:hypothetical protein